MISLPSIQDLKDISGKRVLLRLDFNVPIVDGNVRDDYRIRKSMQTVDFLQKLGARIVIISHIESENQTLKPVYDYLKEKGLSVYWCEDIIESGKEGIDTLKPGDILLSENIRLYDGEKKNDPLFAKKLASLGDLYVNDAFSVSHRSHATIVGIPKHIPHYAGFQFIEEVKQLEVCFTPEHPFLCILGGAKFDTKLPLIKTLLPVADKIFVGGALAHNFYKEAGIEIGESLVSDGVFDTKDLVATKKILLPIDVIVKEGGETSTVSYQSVTKTQTISDAGPDTISMLQKFISEAHLILWNGPLGNYEKGFVDPTKQIANFIVERTKQGGHSVVGGGDTLAAIAELGVEKDITFVSTAGGAMLDFLAQKTLLGIEALLG